MTQFALMDNNAHALGVACTSNPAAASSRAAVDLMATTVGKLVSQPYAVPELTFQATAILTTTGTSVLNTARAAGIRNYLCAFSYQNTNATATSVLIKDGATTIAQFYAPASMAAHASITFPVPLRGTAATALNCNAGTTGASVYINAQGFEAP